MAVKNKKVSYLQASLIKPEDKASIVSKIVNIKTADQAYAFASSEPAFAAVPLDHYGRVVMLRWRGFDVLLLFHRTIHESDIDVGPISCLRSTDDAWIQVDVFSDGNTPEVTRKLAEQLAVTRTELFNLRELHKMIELQYAKFDEQFTNVVTERNAAQMDRECLAELTLACKRCTTALKSGTKEQKQLLAAIVRAAAQKAREAAKKKTKPAKKKRKKP